MTSGQVDAANRARASGALRLLPAGLVLFAVAAYALAPINPLFTGNQNTKFLYGLAKAGVGRLGDDWLIREGSELPIFDAIVYVTRAFAGDWAFYAWHFATTAIFAISMYGIARIVGVTIPDRFGPGARWFLPIFAGWTIALASSDATARLFEGVARQFINGRIFEPQSLGVLALLALLAFRLRQPGWAAVLAVAAAWVHPAYAIPGLLLLGGMVLARWRFGVNAAPMPMLTAAAGAVGCLGAAAFAYSLLQPSDPGAVTEAARLITEQRIPQHSWPQIWMLEFDSQVKLLVLLLAIWMARRDPLGWVLLAGLAGVAILAVWTWAAHDVKLALAAPWRASAILVPAAVAILMGRGLQAAAGILTAPRPRALAVTVTAILGIAGAAIGLHGTYENFTERREPAYYAWVRESARDGDVFLTPVSEENFRLATGQPQYASWKTHPHGAAAAVLAWYQRVARAKEATQTPQPPCGLLDELAADGVTYLVRGSAQPAVECAGWREAYRDDDVVILSSRSS